MTAPFASQAWIDQLSTTLENTAAVRTESVSWVFGPLLLVIDADAEHGLAETAIQLDLREGAIRGVTLVDAATAARVPFVIGGSLARWKSVFSGAASLGDLVLNARMRVRGDLPTLTRHAKLLDAITSAGGSIETSWQDEQEAAAAQA